MAKKNLIPGLSFSWKRAVGISGMKQKISRKIFKIELTMMK